MYTYKVTIVRVVDGDTIDVDIDLGFGMTYSNQRIRLSGIDTPECRTRDDVEKQFGFLAKRFVESLVGEPGSTCTLQSHAFEKGKFGRILGDIVVDGKSMSETMIQEHHAVPYYGQSKEDIQESHLANRKFFNGEI